MSFSWIPIYRELAGAVLKYRNRQLELLNILRAAREQGLPVMQFSDEGAKARKSLDPFSFFAAFNRGITNEKRTAIITFMQERLGLEARAPEDFDGIPTASNMKSFFVWDADEKQMAEDAENLWNMASEAYEKKAEEASPELFEKCLKQKGISVTNLTIGCFWFNPEGYLSLDGCNKGYFKKKYGLKLAASNHAEYAALLEKVRGVAEESYSETSLAAWNYQGGNNAFFKSADDKYSRQYWTYTPGRNGAQWEQFRQEGIMAIDEPIGNFEGYATKDEMRFQLQKAFETESSLVNKTRACWDFVAAIKPGDVVFAKKGLSEVLGYGIVLGGYRYDPDRDSYRHIRDVEWHENETGLRVEDLYTEEVKGFFAVKYLTNITSFPKFVQKISQVAGLFMDEKILFNPKNIDTPLMLNIKKEDVFPYTVNMAMDGLFMEQATFEGMLEALREKRNIILQGAPGVGKTFVAKRLAYALMGEKAAGRVEMIQFHQSYAYEDFIQGYRPDSNGTALNFELKNGVFYSFCKRAIGQPDRDFVFIIDEINRGNLSKIFGELMMLIEHDKRGGDFAIRLTYSGDGDELFYVPENLYLIGMMNTADRSLAMVDYALRRRFRFVDIEPGFETTAFRECLAGCGAPPALTQKIIDRMSIVNADIAADTKNLGRGYRIGHSFFCPRNGSVPDDAWYARIIRNEIVPLLEEYWFDDPEKVDRLREKLLS